MNYHQKAQAFIKSAKSMGMGVTREDDELIATPQMKKAQKLGLATPTKSPIGTTQSAMSAANSKAAKANTLGVGFGGDQKLKKK